MSANNIERKYQAFGGSGGLLGPPVEDVKRCPDGAGLFRRYRNGMIYWSPATGAHEIHGAILSKWESLGYERSFLGYPVSDELDYPKGGLPYPEGGRASFFERGGIYWWPDVGPIELKDVVVHYTGLNCFGETDWDHGSDSDEPYAVIGVVSPDGASSFRSRVYDDVDGGESCPDLVEIYRGKPKGLALSTLVMEHDEGDPDKYKMAMQSAAGAAATGITALTALIPVAGAVIASTVGPILSAVAPKVGEELNKLLDTGDDKIGAATSALSAKDMVVLAARTVNSTDKAIGFKLQTPLLTGEGASYKVYFGVVPA